MRHKLHQMAKVPLNSFLYSYYDGRRANAAPAVKARIACVIRV
jgi:hypothetical protein